MNFLQLLLFPENNLTIQAFQSYFFKFPADIRREKYQFTFTINISYVIFC